MDRSGPPARPAAPGPPVLAPPLGGPWAPPLSAVDHGGPAPTDQPLSFASMARKPSRETLFPILSFPRRSAAIKDGSPAVTFSSLEMKAGFQQLENSVIAKFSVANRPKLPVIVRHIQSNWKLSGDFTVANMDGRHTIIYLNSAKDVVEALTCTSHIIGTSPFRLFRWHPSFDLKKESTLTTAWVRLPSLRPDLFDVGYLECIANQFGRFLDADRNTKLRSTAAYARICVEIDLLKPIPNRIWIDCSDGRPFWQDLVYEGKLAFCTKCKMQGHTFAECRKVRHVPLAKEGNLPAPKPTLDSAPGAGNEAGEWQVVKRKGKQAEPKTAAPEQPQASNPFQTLSQADEGGLDKNKIDKTKRDSGKVYSYDDNFDMGEVVAKLTTIEGWKEEAITKAKVGFKAHNRSIDRQPSMDRLEDYFNDPDIDYMLNEFRHLKKVKDYLKVRSTAPKDLSCPQTRRARSEGAGRGSVRVASPLPAMDDPGERPGSREVQVEESQVPETPLSRQNSMSSPVPRPLAPDLIHEVIQAPKFSRPITRSQGKSAAHQDQ